MGTAIRHPVPDRRAERQSARMSKITNDGLTRLMLYRCTHDNSGRQRVKLHFRVRTTGSNKKRLRRVKGARLFTA